MQIQGCRLSGNSVQGEYGFGSAGGAGLGAGIYNNTAAEVAKCVIESNNAASGGSADATASYSRGGGVFNSGTLSLRSCTIAANKANRGGGLFNAERLSISKCRLGGNEAELGGGLFNDRVLAMQNCWFRTNSVVGRDGWSSPDSGCGGGLYNACTARVTACWFENNSSAGGRGENCGGSAYGAGIFNAGDISVRCSTLNGNSATGRNAFATGGNGFGGAVFNGALGKMVLANTTISSNRASGALSINASNGRGGGIYNQGVASLNHCTVVTNMAQQGIVFQYGPYIGPSGDGSGGGIYAETPVQIANSILAGNGASVGGFDCNGILESEGYNLIGSTSSCTVQGVVAGNIFGVNPLLGPLRACGGFTPAHPLLPGSPAIDAGTAGGLVTDQRGAPRVTDIPNVPNAEDGSDIGAFEARRRDVAITKSAAPEMPVPGQPVTYTIEAANVGLTPVTSVTVLDLLPHEVSFISSAPPPWNGRAFGSMVAYSFGNLGVASQCVISIQASVRRTASGILANNAWAFAYPQDDFLLNNQITLESVLSPP